MSQGWPDQPVTPGSFSIPEGESLPADSVPARGLHEGRRAGAVVRSGLGVRESGRRDAVGVLPEGGNH